MPVRLKADAVEVGDIIRYSSDGSSALGRVHSPHAGGFHIEHVLGGYLLACDVGWGPSGLYAPDETDLAFCRHRRPEWFGAN